MSNYFLFARYNYYSYFRRQINMPQHFEQTFSQLVIAQNFNVNPLYLALYNLEKFHTGYVKLS
jgi:hypothetical protein